MFEFSSGTILSLFESMTVTIKDIPDLILVEILKHLSSDDIHFRCIKVNRRFCDLIQSQFDKVDYIRLDLASEEHGEKALNKLNSHCQKEKPNIKSLTIRFPSVFDTEDIDPTNKDFLELLNNLQTLKALRLEDARDLDSEVVGNGLKELMHLEYLSVDSMSYCLWASLAFLDTTVTLHVDNFQTSARNGFHSFEDNVDLWKKQLEFENIERLHFNHLNMYNPHEICEMDFAWLWSHFPNLKTLQIDDVPILCCSDELVELFKQMTKKCPKLESINVKITNFVEEDPKFTKKMVVTENKHLKRINIQMESKYKASAEKSLAILSKWKTFSKAEIARKKVGTKQDVKYKIILKSKNPVDKLKNPGFLKKKLNEPWINAIAYNDDKSESDMNKFN